MCMTDLADLCSWADILFLALQTPHGEIYEGNKPLPNSRADFDYSYLRACVSEVNLHLTKPTTCAIISTVLPGTLEREVIPLIGANFLLVYEPLFIAMGTVVRDFLETEFVLMGLHNEHAATQLRQFYDTIHQRPIFITDIRTAEGIKVLYNTFITTKTVLANLYGEMAAKLGMNVDDIYKAICLSTDRLLSPKYLKAGMGDGGGCHPRDNIALSYIAQEIGLSFDFFTALMVAREKHAEWLASLIIDRRKELPVFILGRSFKPETNIETGSPAVLLSAILRKRDVAHTCEDDTVPRTPGLYFIGTQHARWAKMKFPEGSVIIDPFRYMPDMYGSEVIRIGDGTMLRESVKA